MRAWQMSHPIRMWFGLWQCLPNDTPRTVLAFEWGHISFRWKAFRLMMVTARVNPFWTHESNAIVLCSFFLFNLFDLFDSVFYEGMAMQSSSGRFSKFSKNVEAHCRRWDETNENKWKAEDEELWSPISLRCRDWCEEFPSRRESIHFPLHSPVLDSLSSELEARSFLISRSHTHTRKIYFKSNPFASIGEISHCYYRSLHSLASNHMHMRTNKDGRTGSKKRFHSHSRR